MSIPPPSAVPPNSKPIGPCVWYVPGSNAPRGQEHQTYTLPMLSLRADLEFHVSTGFVKVFARFYNSAPHPVSGMFALPIKGTVTDASVQMKSGRLLETMVIARDEANKFVEERGGGKEKPQDEPTMPDMGPTDQMVPDLFRLPVPGIPAGEEFSVTVNYIEPLQFINGNYNFFLPLRFPPNFFPQGVSIGNVINIFATINSITPNIKFQSNSHNLHVLQQEQLHLRLQAQPMNMQTNESVDFHLSYFMPSEYILGGLLVQPPNPYSADRRGSFVMFVTPPTRPMGFFPRNIVFILDRSGSMGGQPFQEATGAIATALQNLRQGDRFTIVSFDDQQTYFSQQLVDASPQAANNALNWVQQHQPRALTDIKTPLLWALDLLNRQPKQAQNGSAVMNFVVLLTDGCVDNERDICNAAMQKAGDTRVLTFGIGKYCNWFFLRMLALATRGFNENVVYAHDIGAKITQLMNMASAPVLTDVGLGINVPNCELYPSPIPDLFVGAPLTIAGKFEGQFPPSVTLQGKLCNGQQFTQEVRPAHSQLVPVEKVFLKQRLDMLTSRQWLEDSKKIEQEIVQISTENSFPTPYTTMVAYETTVEKKAEQERKDGDTGETKPDEGDKVEQKQELPPQDSKGKHTAAKAAAVMVGGAFLVGAAVYTFGDPAATLANASSLVGGIGDFFGGGIGAIGNLGNCCGSLVECFSCGSCGDCGDLFGNCGCGGCGELLDGAGSCLSETFNCCGGACGSAFEACSSSVQDIFSSCDCGVCDGCKDLLGNCSGVGEICSTICSPIGSCIGAVGGAIGSICGDLIGTIGDCVGSCDCGALCGSVGGLCSSVGDCAGSVCGSLGDCVGSCDCGSITDILGDICDVLD